MLEVTPAATARIKADLEARGLGNCPLRIAAVHGPHGCLHGYSLLPEREVVGEDRVVTRDGLQFVVQEDIAAFLEGARIDWDGSALAIECPESPPPRHQGGCGGPDAP